MIKTQEQFEAAWDNYFCDVKKHQNMLQQKVHKVQNKSEYLRKEKIIKNRFKRD